MTEQEIRDGVAERQWFHNIRLPHNIITPGTREPGAWEMYRLPKRLDGMSVIDIGAWEGGFSFEAERRGADSVLAMDVWGNQDGDPGSGGYGWDNFQFAHRALKSKVATLNRNVYDIEPSMGTYDVVLFLEVLYHLQHPIFGLEKVASLVHNKGLLVLETWIDCVNVDYPAMAFYETTDLAGDPTNWWGPNQKCVEALLRTVGFKHVKRVYMREDVHLGGRGQRACFHATR